MSGAGASRIDATIKRLHVRRIDALMPRPWVPHAPHLHVLVVEVETSDGLIGTGFSWTPTIATTAVRALLEDDIHHFVIGETADPQHLWPRLWAHLHEAGGGGVTTIAMAGLDLALWDIAGIRSGLPLADLIGRRRATVATYGSGVNLHYTLAELVAQAERWVASGFDTVKIKVGRPDLAEDVARVGAVRDVLGPHRTLLIDANQRWDLPRAIRSLNALAQLDPGWIEEPLRADDTAGYRALAAELGSWSGGAGIPIALGENLHTIHRFRDLIDSGAAAVLQPNVIRVGGITPFLEIAALIEASPAALAPHLLPEISGQLAMALPGEVHIEDVEDADFEALGILARPSPVKFSRAGASSGPTLTDTGSPGLGLSFEDR